MRSFFYTYVIVLGCLLIYSCQPAKEEKQVQLFNSYCSSCHVAPRIDDLTKNLWDTKILPEMAARMGIKEDGFNPYKGMEYEEMQLVFKSGIYPNQPAISLEDWQLLRAYIVQLAPDSLTHEPSHLSPKKLEQFKSNSISIDDEPGTFITYFDFQSPELMIGGLNGILRRYSYAKKQLDTVQKLGSGVIDFTQSKTYEYFTEVGILDPSELAKGVLYIKDNGQLKVVKDQLHRPVYTQIVDVNDDGKEELLVSEFGHLTGKFSMLIQEDDTWIQRDLLHKPGTIKSELRDLNKDGKKDIVILTAQGDEAITVLYQTGDLQFRAEQLIRFSPIYGTSWFELIDYNLDGFLDIVTVHGDNADKTYVHKPYHGLRIHINDGQNKFNEVYFYSLNGATRFVSEDFDADGDYDFGIISTFPDYEQAPELSFVYLENTGGTTSYEFQPRYIEEANEGRWLLMDSGDFDQDGDIDIALSAFSYSFTPVPRELAMRWQQNNVDLLILENKHSD